MKSNMLIKQVVAGLAVAVFISGASVALAADVILSGDVAAITTVTVGATTDLGAGLGLGVVGPVTVATATEINNVTAGYTVTVSSLNAAAAAAASTNTLGNVSKLICAANPATPITYTMTYGGTSVALDAATGAFSINRTSAVNAPTGVTKALAVTTEALTSALAGTYTDTITLSVVAI